MMMVLKNIALLVITFATLAITEDDSKWVWKSGNRRSEDVRESSSSGDPRYEVFEGRPPPHRPGGFRPPPDYDRPSRPIGIHQESGFPDRPYPDRPGLGPLFVPNERPGGIRPPGGFPPDRPLRPHPDDGILTGPVPSWVKDPPFKNYDRCKCAEKFNCNSPGISYGQCDVGKQYCCFNSKKDGPLGGPLPSRPIHSPENGILVGPGGPVDFPSRPHRPYPRPPRPHYDGAGEHNGILVGPGGPTGIVGRPPNRPFGGGANIHSPEFGILAGPGGPHDVPYRPGGFGYGPRNAKKE